jgi:peptidoglycan-associated lipoprotein
MLNTKRVGFFTVLTAATLLAACSSTPIDKPVATPVVTQASAPPPPPSTSQTLAQPAAPIALTAKPLAPYLDPQNPLRKERSVYFDFDKALLRPEAGSLIELHGKFLASNPTVSIKIEGNTDEQGGSEYNLALGQKRAEAVLNALKVFGVKDSQLEAISFGKEKPLVLGHDESSHAQNRRADLAYPAK